MRLTIPRQMVTIEPRVYDRQPGFTIMTGATRVHSSDRGGIMAGRVRDAVLAKLQNNKGQYLSGEKLSDQLGVSRAAVWKAIRGLREEGYPIEAMTNRGYLLPDSPEVITEEEIRRYLPARYRDNGLYLFDVLDSTNNKARQLAAEGGQVHGSTVIALQQTGGKGRLGRNFFSPKEGIYFSIIIRPDFDLRRSVLVTVAAAAAVAEAIESVSGQRARIKWVNDVYVGGKKVCGILTEGITDFESGQIDHLVIGIGINTTTKGFPKELQDIAGAVEGEYSRPALVAGVITRVLDYLGNIEAREFLQSYRRKSMLIGEDVMVFRGVYRQNPEEEMDGRPARVTGIDEDGGLKVIYTDGTRETLVTGEVTVRRTGEKQSPPQA